MNKLLLAYGPTTARELYDALLSEIEDAKLLYVGSLQGRQSSLMTNLMFEDIRKMTGHEQPSIALISASEMKDVTFKDIFAGYDIVLTYDYVPETGVEMFDVYRPLQPHRHAKVMVRLRYFSPMDQKTDAAYSDIVSLKDLSLDPVRRHSCLRLGEIDWADVIEQTPPIDVETLSRLTETFNILNFEDLFFKEHGEYYEKLEINRRISYRMAIWPELFDHFYRQLQEIGETSLTFHDVVFLGYSKEKLTRYNELLPYLQDGVLYKGRLIDSKPCFTLGWTLDDVLSLGEELKALPPETVVTAVDYTN